MQHVYNCTGHELRLPDIVGAEDVYIVDGRGKRYLDLESGVWCISVGHNNRDVRGAAFRQWDELVHAGFAYSNPVVDSAAKRLLDVVGMHRGQCVFLCSGSEAIEISRQISRHLTGFETSLTFSDSYLGAYSSVSDRRVGWCTLDWLGSATNGRRMTSAEEDRIIESIPDNVSDFILEPGSSSGYVRFPPESMVKRVVDTVRAKGGKIIANEVTTGTGRTGRWFGYQHYGIEPDMIAVGKGIGNGYPVSVAVMSPHTIDELRGTAFHYSQSHQNDPLGASIVQEVINVIERRQLVVEAVRKGSELLSDLRESVDHSIVLDVRGR
ncbi:MAG: aminotransferase class III-fold pyridoxal phosphate-dependent enzyme, partial [Spirochaetales bacterium]|nr:aminotransferase class III-fold pyridoxal phosphate-dependent enzyme [Spirochaetales bacterium]